MAGPEADARTRKTIAGDPTRGQPRKSAEATLDALLNLHQQRETQQAEEAVRAAQAPDPIEQLRRKMREELVPAFEGLKEKYSAQGLAMEFDPSDFLDGGRTVAFVFALKAHYLRLRGTVVEGRIAFSEILSQGNDNGVMSGGPMLLTRTLGVEQFREFVCERIATLVGFVLRQNR